MIGKARPEVLDNAAVRHIRDATDSWGRLTGQQQNWSLFAPEVGNRSAFPGVVMQWDGDGPHEVLLLSNNEPADPGRYFRVGGFRTRCYEDSLDLDLPVGQDELDRLEDINGYVRKDWRRIRTYLGWRLHSYQAAHPGTPAPRRLILVVRSYSTPPPERRPWSWDGPVQQPVARWQPSAAPAPGFLPVEAYNPVSGRFELLRGDDGGEPE